MQSNCRGRVEIGRQARLRIWCREAYGFDSLRPHSKKAQLYSWAFFVGTSAEHAVEGNLRFLNPCHFVTSPFRGTPTTPYGGSGGPAASTFCESLADADAAAPKRLRYARKSVSFFESGNPSVFANDVCMSLFGSCLAEIVQVSRPVFLKLSATECVPWLHCGIFCEFGYKSEIS